MQPDRQGLLCNDGSGEKDESARQHHIRLSKGDEDQDARKGNGTLERALKDRVSGEVLHESV